MPLCGLKQSKKQKRDHSPPYSRDLEDVTKIKDLEGSIAKQKESYERLKQKYDELNLKQQETTADVEKATSLFTEVAGSKLENGVKETQEKLEKEYQQKNEELHENFKKEFETQKADLEERQRRLQTELDQTKDRLELEASDRAKFEAEKEKLKREKDRIEQSLNLTKKELEIAQKESHIPRSPTRSPSEEWKAKILVAETELQKEREQRMNKERELSRLLSESDQLQKEKETVQAELEQVVQSAVDEDVLNSLKQDLETAEKNHKNELSRKESEQAELAKKLEEVANANDALMSRLSAATAAQVLDNNPNISDLSDPNRPQKLGERFMTLYETQWTEASDCLEKLEKNEEDIVSTLLDLVVAVYKHCKESAETQLSRIEEDIFLPPLETPTSPQSPESKDTPVKTPSKQSMSKIPRFSSHKGRPTLPNMNTEKKTVDSETNGKDKERMKRSLSYPKVKGEKFPEIPVEVRKGIKEYRKAVCKKVTPVIEREVMNMLPTNGNFEEKVVDACKSFISACVEICWLMNIQDPPVTMEWKAPGDSVFNADIYKAYLKNGDHVDYIVWPTLYLYEGGPVLTKGVAQGME